MSKQFVFIDARVSDYQVLQNGLIQGAQAHLLDPSIDGLAQIAEFLAAQPRSSVDSLSIVAHGAPGLIHIGPAGLSLSDVDASSELLSVIGRTLTKDASVRLYACAVGAGHAGQVFVNALSKAIGADVAAASDLVGAAEKGGDWALDIGMHQFVSDAPFLDSTLANYSETLAAPMLGFLQTFKDNTDGVFGDGSDYGTVTRVPNGTKNLTAPDGDGYFALVAEGPNVGDAGPYTKFSGYTTKFVDGQQADVRVYLDPTWSQNQGFQYTVAANGTDGNHRRDFGFQVRATGTTIEVSASNGGTFSPVTSTIPGSYVVATAGWYTLQHNFNNVGGALSVDLNLVGPVGVAHLIRTLSDPSDTIGVAVGGTRYGWFTDVSITGGLAVDDYTLGALTKNVVEAANSVATVGATGAISFSDADNTSNGGDSHSVTSTPAAGGYVGSFTVARSSEPTDAANPGVVNWTFSASNSDLDHLAAGQTVNQTYTVTVADSAGATSSQKVIVTLVGINDAPIATNLTTSQNYAKDTALNLTDIVVSDVDDGANITASLTLSSAAAGSLSTNGGGTYNAGTGVWSVSGSLAAVNAALAAVSFLPATNYVQNVTIATSVSDGIAASITGTITLSVAAAGGGGGGNTGTSGPDDITGTSGNDNITTGEGADTVHAGQGNDTVTAGNGGNIIVGGDDSNDGPDLITSGTGNDLIYGNGGDDTISSNGGNDVIVGGFGNDLITTGGDNDLIYGNENNDTIMAGEGQNVVIGGKGDDQITAGAGSDLLFGNEGADTINAGDGNNTIVGGQDSTDGSDRLTAGSGNDIIFGNGGDDTISGGEGQNVLVGGVGNDAVTAGAGNDIIYGNQDNDTINGGDGANLIFGGMGDDVVVTGSGNDTLWGNEGNDTLTGGGGADRYVFAAGSGADLVKGFVSGDGDRLDLQGQTYVVGQDAQGSAVLTLSGGGTIVLEGVAANQVGANFFA